jgi:hypothetical protein
VSPERVIVSATEPRRITSGDELVEEPGHLALTGGPLLDSAA